MRATTLLLLFCSFTLSVEVGGNLIAQSEIQDQKQQVQSKDSENVPSATVTNTPISVEKARVRARILHETFHGTLQVMHRDFFREDEGRKIPSRSLEDVFSELKRSHEISLRWIAVDLEAMNIDNKPQSDFEKEAVRVLKSGKPEYESVIGNEFHFAGKIRLSATCLSCHASRRSSNDDRAAGLIISFPLKPSERVPKR
ncbi:MAG: DUF3365 domain-containing protein [Planctomycetaceae bacterium]|nr:DUF3365 domain-containing protein [Planctomycetaceae bacterium]